MTALVAVLVAAALAAPVEALTADDLFDDRELHDIWIHMNARDWAQLRATYMENTFYPCDVEWRGLKVRNAGCRSRGTGTRNGVKPGLRLDFNHYVAAQELLGLEGAVLDNLWQDGSMLKERLAMRLFDHLEVPAPRTTYVRLYIGSDRTYIGLYALVEEIDETFARRQFGRGDGYLYEYRWKDEYRFEDLGPELEPYAYRFEPRTRVRESMFSLYAPIRDLVQAINEADEGELEAALAPHLDLRMLVTQLAVENYLADWDGLLGYAGLSNFYLHRSADGGPFHVLPWDKDTTFAWLHMPPWHNVEDNVLGRKLWNDRRLRADYLAALLEAASAAADLEGEALRAVQQIHDAAVEDPLKPYSNEQFEEAVADVVEFARHRAAIVRRFVREIGSVADAGPRVQRPGDRDELPFVAVAEGEPQDAEHGAANLAVRPRTPELVQHGASGADDELPQSARWVRAAVGILGRKPFVHMIVP
ncbi:MAG: hypothetical protein A3I61_10325 [Acidobacteria bacterium RIFCSPLOWO2_02_FULL_68_18]|nr:MAG: hypothetical protein A3I61_10325 [Acidobacteria bacterium RIFCSPLOWO2_02_FULL_68_18]OFW48647.1 MAG: hypothetical protein A3G77_14160 [Acidobacteria bacterium RIFCSPLOWO2_12_FULL_68_19]